MLPRKYTEKKDPPRQQFPNFIYKKWPRKYWLCAFFEDLKRSKLKNSESVSDERTKLEKWRRDSSWSALILQLANTYDYSRLEYDDKSTHDQAEAFMFIVYRLFSTYNLTMDLETMLHTYCTSHRNSI